MDDRENVDVSSEVSSISIIGFVVPLIRRPAEGQRGCGRGSVMDSFETRRTALLNARQDLQTAFVGHDRQVSIDLKR